MSDAFEYLAERRAALAKRVDSQVETGSTLGALDGTSLEPLQPSGLLHKDLAVLTIIARRCNPLERPMADTSVRTRLAPHEHNPATIFELPNGKNASLLPGKAFEPESIAKHRSTSAKRTQLETFDVDDSSPPSSRAYQTRLTLPDKKAHVAIPNWSGTDYVCFLQSRLQTGMSAMQAFSETVQQYIVINPAPPSLSGRCAYCGASERQKDPLMPIVTRAGHGWIHDHCHRAFSAVRQEMAIRALAGFGIRSSHTVQCQRRP
jgi:hypothetical protein